MANGQAPDNSPYRVWDRVKVSKDLFDLLIKHPLFQAKPEAINTAQYWLRAIDAAVERNDGKPVTWDYRDIESRFRSFRHSHTHYRDALRDLGLLTFTPYRPPANAFAEGECRNFAITDVGRRLVTGGIFQWLYHLLKDPQTRRRNQVAISKRKMTLKAYEEPIKQIIDGFNRSVEFDVDAVLAQLRRDEREEPGRFNSALHHLLAIVRRDFGNLEIKEGRIYHEFVGLSSKYRQFALFRGRPYVATLDVRACHPTFLGRLLWEFYTNEAAAIDAKLGVAVNRVDLEREHREWTGLFTDHDTDPRDAIVREAGITTPRADFKDCLNSWLNGARQYKRRTDGRTNRTDNRRLEAWFQRRFPEMARVWTAMEDRRITGRLITEEYEGPLMLDPALYGFADGLGLTLAYEYDGVGVFAERDDHDITGKLDKVKAFIQQNAVRQFGVAVVVR
ncbi:MAG TPA: hypothetical protein PKI20_02455 [Verrucomicrobiota bacterium]|jgi:hypothetical protein|nr:hypothetical protein [Verrucomicrobiota bacterium]HQL76664.1 hypothetical protein [Verrucomicrobiota bacterium]